MLRSLSEPYRAVAFSILMMIVSLTMLLPTHQSPLPTHASLLSDPFLQLPTATSVRVVWFTDFLGSEHKVLYGDRLKRAAIATTTRLSRTREDEKSNLVLGYPKTTVREIWRHEAEVTGLVPGQRLPYRAISTLEERQIKSKIFTLAGQPKRGMPLKILLTSDHQLMPMVAANLQKVAETVGQVDAIFFAGDLVNIPDRASEWFDDSRGGAFFPCLQGRANYALEKNGKTTLYQGGELIQYAPLFPAIGNHEVMGKFSPEKSLNEQFNAAFPRPQAEKLYRELAAQINPYNDPSIQDRWLEDASFNTKTYTEIFTLPQQSSGTPKYYALTFGDIRLVVLYITNIWRSPSLDPQVRGRYQERQEDLNTPQNWGYGQHIFEPITQGSPQYEWLEAELSSEAFRQAKYKIVMFHHPVHTLGGNIVPPYTDPVARLEYSQSGQLQSVRYDYPPEKDYLLRDLMPLLESAGVQFVFYGHSHLWNRFLSPRGIHFLESSNVGNSYGAHLGENQRPIPTDNPRITYAATGDPNGLEPIVPTLAPLLDENSQPIPYIASNDITVFSILDTSQGTVSSYRFDTRDPDSEVIKFDQFAIAQ